MQATEIQFVSHLNSCELWKELGPTGKGQTFCNVYKDSSMGHSPFGEQFLQKDPLETSGNSSLTTQLLT